MAVVKVNRIEFIEALEARVTFLKNAEANDAKANEEYLKAIKEFESSYVVDPSNIKSVTLGNTYRSTGYDHVSITLKKPVKGAPKKPEATCPLDSWELRGALKELEGMARVLKLSSEETVNASVSNKVAQYL